MPMITFRSVFCAWLCLTAVGSAQEQAALWHFKPQSHALGDVHPFFHQGECYLYYLKPGSFEAALARSSDWLRWQETPLSHEKVLPGDWMSPYYVLGVFQDASASVFRSFYGHAQGRMVSSVSQNLRNWRCAPKEFHLPAADYYQRRRDPYVFWIPEMKKYGCVMTTWMKNRPKESGGAVSLATSEDLQHWQDHGPIWDSGTSGEPECPQMFPLDGRWYLLASLYDRAVGQPTYWVSDSPLGPWERDPKGVLDGKDLCAAQVAEEDGRLFLFGWIPLEPAQPGKQTWGGHLALPREVYALQDGRLGTRLPARLAEKIAKLSWHDFQPENSWLSLAVDFSLLIREETRMEIAPLGQVSFRQDGIRVLDAAGECWSKLETGLSNSQPVHIQVFVEDNIVEVFADGRFSLAARLPRQAGRLKLRFHPAPSSQHLTKIRVSEWGQP
jgi:sucrose-6-phosphate hydrolase SacC (GH32 family)